PIIAVFPGPVDRDLIPAGIRVRLYVSLTDPDWVERVVAAVEGRATTVPKPPIKPYSISVHPYDDPGGRWQYAIEDRPRAGVWSPFIAAVPLAERDQVNPFLRRGPFGHVPGPGMLHRVGEGESDDHQWWYCTAGEEATPTQSYYVLCAALPSKIA